jgi:hypothetical protein
MSANVGNYNLLGFVIEKYMDANEMGFAATAQVCFCPNGSATPFNEVILFVFLTCGVRDRRNEVKSHLTTSQFDAGS